ncbi:MFS transporter [Ruania albidiflava]|uniref:MFS transporter n=1 Tax=Ruania albidiflava TaxID=366586 RepID=UPI0012F9487D|nr:MFS transporter [Ruania albidiflava]
MTSIAFESFAVTTVLPVAMTDLDGAQWYSLAYAATITAALVGMVIGGNWSDRSGPRRPLVAGGSLFLGGLALCMVAPEPSTFVLGRLLQGIGGGIDSVVLYVLIARRIPERPRPRMFGLLTTAWLVPSLVGPVLAGALTDLMTWRVVFGIVLAGAAISLGGLLHVTRDPGMHSTEPVGDGPARPIIGRNGTLSLVAALLLVLLHLGGQLDPPSIDPGRHCSIDRPGRRRAGHPSLGHAPTARSCPAACRAASHPWRHCHRYGPLPHPLPSN